MVVSSNRIIESTQWRLIISGTIMFLFFGLIPSFPPIHFNKDVFPGTRHMMTVHLEATQNGIMLIAMALIMPWLNLSNSTILLVYEVAANLGAWFNVFPWIYAARTAAVLQFHPETFEGQVTGNKDAIPPENNDYHVSIIIPMLMICAISDVIAWTIALVALLQRGRTKKD
jgi:hypothetical protein